MDALRPWLMHPWALWLLAILPVLGGFALWSWIWRRRALRTWGLLTAREGPRGRRLLGRRLRGLCLLLVIPALILGIAGPQWGQDLTPTGGAGRDLVVVLDVSRSMLAGQPSRQKLAQDMLADLAVALEKRGGHRVALVVFAAQPRLVCPLTNDYDYFLDTVLQQDADNLPRALRPQKDGPDSGTRIGAGLRLAVLARDAQSAGHQDILLFSDGVDPVDDQEWLEGVTEAHKHGIAVHVVGVGDPVNADTIVVPKSAKVEEQKIASRLQEARLQEIARRTDGIYFAARTQRLAPDTLFRDILQSRPARADEGGSIPALQPQYRWFLAAALGLLGLTMLTGVRISCGARLQRAKWLEKRHVGNVPHNNITSSPRPALVALSLLLLVSAAPLLEPDELVRQGNAAFARQEYEQALSCYEQAEERTRDPGLVAFNKGAALYRLGRYREAELSYLRCLEDQAAPGARRARALYDLGTSLLQPEAVRDAVDALERAADCFARCLRHPDADAALVADAEHNLELARLLWHQAKQEAAKRPPPREKDQPEHKDRPLDAKKSTGGILKKGYATTKEGKGKDGAIEGDKKIDGGEKSLGPSLLDSVPDKSDRISLTRDDADKLLAQEVTRIDRARRAHRNQPIVTGPQVKDW